MLWLLVSLQFTFVIRYVKKLLRVSEIKQSYYLWLSFINREKLKVLVEGLCFPLFFFSSSFFQCRTSDKKYQIPTWFSASCCIFALYSCMPRAAGLRRAHVTFRKLSEKFSPAIRDKQPFKNTSMEEISASVWDQFFTRKRKRMEKKEKDERNCLDLLVESWSNFRRY